ncbi:MAG: aconitate hydratase [Spirochaetaceae bacterium]|nr:aconitate hydratase [Spirochaetaceae bacterium]
MGKSVAQKILEPHIVAGSWSAGGEIGIQIDQTLTQDATGTMAYLQFETMGVSRVRTELSVSYIDHNTMQLGFENADDHAYLTSIASKYGIYLSRAGNGICHQVHLERFGAPGKTLLGSDSHTPTGGGLGMIAIGAGGLDVAMAMAGAPFYMPCPEVVGIELTGAFGPWVSAKDLALKVLEIFGTKGNVGRIFEYRGPGAASLTVQERATVANMGAECGVTSSLFPSDEKTRLFLRSQGREAAWREILPDPDAAYSRVERIDLAAIEPMIAIPHSPGNVKKVSEVAGLTVDQGCIGSCTNSSFRDLAIASAILKGKVAASGTSLFVTPGSRQVVREILAAGALDPIVAAGARLVEPSCSFCIGNGVSPASGAVSLRTSNRNFEGRSGTADAKVYLVSPETAAASALAGEIADPRTLGAMPDIAMPERSLVDDRLILPPAPESQAASVEIRRGPNIGQPPAVRPFPEVISGVAAIKLGDKVTTDHIMPAGARMKYRSNIKAYSAFVFEGVDPSFAARAAANRDAGSHNVIVAGLSYGQGSSREHAAICPAYLGVRAVLARSFERIHAANLVNFGILPLTLRREEDWAAIEVGDRLEIPGAKAAVASGAKSLVVRDTAKGVEFEVSLELSAREREILLAGGALAWASAAHAASASKGGAR